MTLAELKTEILRVLDQATKPLCGRDIARAILATARPDRCSSDVWGSLNQALAELDAERTIAWWEWLPPQADAGRYYFRSGRLVAVVNRQPVFTPAADPPPDPEADQLCVALFSGPVTGGRIRNALSELDLTDQCGTQAEIDAFLAQPGQFTVIVRRLR